MTNKRSHIIPFLSLFTLLWMAVPVLGQEQGWEKKWNATIAAAKKEGKVIVRGFLGSQVHRGPTTKFTKRYGVPVEYITGRSSQMADRMRRERRARHYTVDIFLSGLGALSRMYHEDMLDPLKPQLILPEVLDGSKWKTGKLWFSDPKGQYLLRLQNYITGMLYINTDHVKPEEFQSAKDLLNPKWRGKITADDPRVSGSGINLAAGLYLKFGEEFVKRLYIDQKPVISRNGRQRSDWLIRGVYPIAFNINSRDRVRLKREGFPIKTIRTLSDWPGAVSASSGMLALINKAPHPNAARLFINWIASREGALEHSRAQIIASTRNDVDESFLVQEAIPRPGVKYFDTYSWDFAVNERRKVQARIKELLGN